MGVHWVLGRAVVLILSVFVVSATSHAAPACYNIFVREAALELPEELTIMSYNPETLMWSESAIENNHNPNTSAPLGVIQSKRQAVKALINEINPDLLMLTEVGDLTALKQLSGRLTEKYTPLYIEGNDPHNMNISFLIKKDLPIEVTYETHKNMKWRDPVDGEVKKLFVRDAPAVLLRQQGRREPFLIVIGAHSKSMRHRGGDVQSKKLRTAEFEGYISIIHGYQRVYGQKVPIVLVGDFNTDLHRAPEAEVLKKELTSAFDAVANPTPVDQRTTHTFHPESNEVVRHQIDDIMVTDVLRSEVIEAQIYRYKDAFGNTLPIPRNREERDRQPSDHFPIHVKIKLLPYSVESSPTP